MVNTEFENRFETALQDELGIDSPTFKQTIEDNLKGLQRAARSGSTDAVLSALLGSSAEGGAYVGSQPLLNNQEFLEGTDEDKKRALRKLADRLSELQKAEVKPELVGDVLSELQHLVS